MSSEHQHESGAVQAFDVSASSVAADDGSGMTAVVDLQLRRVELDGPDVSGPELACHSAPTSQLAAVAEAFTSDTSGGARHFYMHPDEAGRLGKLLIDAAFAIGQQLSNRGAHAAELSAGEEHTKNVEQVGVAKRFRVAPGTVERTSGDSVRVVMLDFAVVSGSEAHDPDAAPSTDTVLMDVDAARTLGHEITAVTDSMTPTAPGVRP